MLAGNQRRRQKKFSGWGANFFYMKKNFLVQYDTFFLNILSLEGGHGPIPPRLRPCWEYITPFNSHYLFIKLLEKLFCYLTDILAQPKIQPKFKKWGIIPYFKIRKMG